MTARGDKVRQAACLAIWGAGQILAGEQGGRVATRITEAVKLGSVETCFGDNCLICKNREEQK